MSNPRIIEPSDYRYIIDRIHPCLTIETISKKSVSRGCLDTAAGIIVQCFEDADVTC